MLVQDQKIIPIEVKWTEMPSKADIKHLNFFMDLYKVKQGYVICRTPNKMLIAPNIIALPWQALMEVI